MVMKGTITDMIKPTTITDMIKPTTYASCCKEWELTKDVYVVQLEQKDKKLKYFKKLIKML